MAQIIRPGMDPSLESARTCGLYSEPGEPGHAAPLTEIDARIWVLRFAWLGRRSRENLRWLSLQSDRADASNMYEREFYKTEYFGDYAVHRREWFPVGWER